MATVTHTVEKLDTWKDKSSVISYLNMANGDIGTALEMPGWADRSIQIHGTFGTGGTVVIQGSNDGSNWATLTDPQGNEISITTAKIEQVMEITRYIRPAVTAGNGSTNLNVIILVRRNS